MNQLLIQIRDPPCQGFSASRARSFSPGQGSRPGRCGMLNCIPGTHPPNARSLLQCSCDNQNCPQMFPSVPWGDRVVHGGDALVLGSWEGGLIVGTRVEKAVGIVEGQKKCS